MSNPSYIDKALKRVQDGERRAYMRLRTHLGLSPLPSRPSTSASASSTATVVPIEAPPPIPARNPARGHHYTGSHIDAASGKVSPNEVAKQEQRALHTSNVAEKRSNGRNEVTEASYADHKKSSDAKEKSDAMMDDLSDAIGQALSEWKDASNHE